MVWVCGEVPRGRVPGVVVAKHQCMRGDCVVVCVLEPLDDWSKLQKLFDADIRSVHKCDRSSNDGREWGSFFVSERVRDDVWGVEDLTANLLYVFG